MSTILVVDDDEAIVEALEAALQMRGHTVISTMDADSAVGLALEGQPDLILLDYLLSGSNGSEVLMDLKQSALTRTIPIVMLSAHPKAQDEAKNSGARAFLAKPFDLNTLYEIVDEICIQN